MKIYDDVRLIVDREEYLKENVHKGDTGTIWMPEIRGTYVYVQFDNDDPNNWYKYCEVDFRDLELIEDNHCSDESILEELPKNNPSWWCKVEDGYIKNLLGEKKNKIPFDYES